MLSRVEHDPSTWQEPPEWAKQCLERLCLATGFDGPVGMATYGGEWPERVGTTEKPQAFATLFSAAPATPEAGRPGDGTPERAQDTDPQPIVVIFLPPWAEDTDQWRLMICHEFMHVLHMPLQQFVWPLLDDEQKEEWTRQLEVITKLLTFLLMVSLLVKMEVINDGDGGANAASIPL